jgi:GNAT superfamily N-acetyltransferase
MATRPVAIRPMASDDSDGLRALIEAAPDTGAVRIRVRHLIPSVVAVTRTRPRSVGVVADMPGEGIVGAAAMSYIRIGIDGEPVTAALLHSLAVAPAHRGRGIARQLTDWRVARVRADLGDHVPLVAGIQHGNAASIANARRWSTQLLGPMTIGAAPIRSRARPSPDWDVGPAQPNELEPAARELNRFHIRHQLWAGTNSEALLAWMATSPLDQPIHHVWVARDRAGSLLAGALFTESFRIVVREVLTRPMLLRLLNPILRLLPADGRIALLDIGPLWFVPGRFDAARALLAGAGQHWAGHATHLGFCHDPSGPVGPLLPSGPFAATSRIQIALGWHGAVSEDRPLAPLPS